MVRFATIGTNWITGDFVEAAKTCDGFEYKAVYSRNAEKGRTFAEKHGAELVYDDLDAMLGSDDIDAVYIASPNSFHAPQAIKCMQHGKHVLCEKPVASNERELREMLECARNNDVLFMEAFKSILMPGFEIYRNALPKIGRLRHVFAVFSKYSTRYDAHKRGENLNTFKPEFSNGALLDLGVYCLYPIIALFGEPEKIKAVATVIPDGVDGVGTAILEYDGFVATVNYSKISTSYLPCEFSGENGTMTVDKFNIPEKIDILYRDGTAEAFPFYAREDSMCYEVEEFIKCVESGKRESSVNTHELSLRVMRVMDEIRRQCGVVYPADKA
ncbi:MAG: Gfo/Idh/MocA family protein [Eubacteriales bacterium]